MELIFLKIRIKRKSPVLVGASAGLKSISFEKETIRMDFIIHEEDKN